MDNVESYDSSSGKDLTNEPTKNYPERGNAPADDKNVPNCNDEDNTPTIKYVSMVSLVPQF